MDDCALPPFENVDASMEFEDCAPTSMGDDCIRVTRLSPEDEQDIRDQMVGNMDELPVPSENGFSAPPASPASSESPSPGTASGDEGSPPPATHYADPTPLISRLVDHLSDQIETIGRLPHKSSRLPLGRGHADLRPHISGLKSWPSVDCDDPEAVRRIYGCISRLAGSSLGALHRVQDSVPPEVQLDRGAATALNNNAYQAWNTIEFANGLFEDASAQFGVTAVEHRRRTRRALRAIERGNLRQSLRKLSDDEASSSDDD